MDHILTYDQIEIIGAMAGALTTSAFAPQVFKSFKTKSVEDISLVMYGALCTGIVLWIVYGAFITSWPLIIANVVTLSLAGSVLVMRIVYTSRKPRP